MFAYIGPGLGLSEILIVGAILFVFVGVPIAIVVVAIILVNRSKSSKNDDPRSDVTDEPTDVRR